MYNLRRQMWQSDSKPRVKMNPIVFWWGMKEVSRVGNHGGGNPVDSWRTNTLPMPTGRAPPKNYGVFLLADRQGALANSLHGLNPKNTALSSPESKRRPALIERLVKDWVHGGNKAQSISESIRHAHLGLFCVLSSLERVGKPFFPPLVELCLKRK